VTLPLLTRTFGELLNNQFSRPALPPALMINDDFLLIHETSLRTPVLVFSCSSHMISVETLSPACLINTMRDVAQDRISLQQQRWAHISYTKRV
jgi:hypothetical protein